ncbi:MULTISPECIES: hypothetical protein [unclassified Fictibacillus]|uniref:hypothetical protein n=1 Tax=unclassified Fictibacillus TaxID=2644029 RepID=UPI000780D599|nr:MULTISPECIES: hypothetical protein [unclassified Fictibacillus]MED2972259.1 hypothetical protein [Fictibacillus sp. B-59209]
MKRVITGFLILTFMLALAFPIFKNSAFDELPKTIVKLTAFDELPKTFKLTAFDELPKTSPKLVAFDELPDLGSSSC